MSDRDVLAVAARALHERAATDAGPPDAVVQRTRARVLLAARATRRRRGGVTAVLVPIAAVLVLSTAWAGSRGGLPAAWRSLRAVITGVDARAPSTLVARRAPHPSPQPEGAPLPAPPPLAVAPAVETVPTYDVEDLPVSPVRPPSAARDRPGPASAAPQPITATSPSPPQDARPADEDDLYAAAHRAHFVDHDPEAALRAWDAYLRAAPAGRLAMEAQYDRAITLVRLHRDDDARAALAPFAAGAYGAYRRAEARALLEALDGARRR